MLKSVDATGIFQNLQCNGSGHITVNAGECGDTIKVGSTLLVGYRRIDGARLSAFFMVVTDRRGRLCPRTGRARRSRSSELTAQEPPRWMRTWIRKWWPRQRPVRCRRESRPLKYRPAAS
jgi:hypothetical protein